MENVIAWEVANAFLEKFGGDSVEEIQRNYNAYLEQVRSY
jgi:chorismate synthase